MCVLVKEEGGWKIDEPTLVIGKFPLTLGSLPTRLTLAL